MESIIMHIAKSALLLTLFWGIYRLCLRGETFYTFNRFFLITGIILSLTMPLITIHFPVEVTAPEIPVTLTTTTSVPLVADALVTESITEAPVINWLLIAYLAGIGILLLLRSHGLMRLFTVVKRYGYKNSSGYKLVESPVFSSAFSFFKLVFMPQIIRSENERELILKHESAHISQYHWLDLLLADLLCITQWFNPVVWIYSQAIKENHEFLADNAVIQTVNKTYYQQILVNQWCNISVFPVANSFCYSSQLKRINMMKKNISNPVKKTFVLLTVPALALFLWAFAEPEYIVTNSSVVADKIVVTDTPVPTNAKVITTNPNTDTETIRTVIPSTKPGDTVYYKKGDVLIKIDDKKNIKNKGNEEANKKADKSVESTITFTVGSNRTGFPKEKMLLVVDGKPSDKKLGQLNAEDIYSMNISKKEQFVKDYGKEAENGVIFIITKQGGRGPLLESNGFDIKGIVTDENGTPLKDAQLVIYPEKPTSVSNENGKFTLRVLPEDFITVLLPGYMDTTIGLDPRKTNREYTIKLKKITPGTEITLSSMRSNLYPKADLRKISDFLNIELCKKITEKGVAVLDYTIDTNGNFSNPKLIIEEGNDTFKAAIETVLNDFPKVTPPTKDGIPVKLRVKKHVIRTPYDNGIFTSGTKGFGLKTEQLTTSPHKTNLKAF